MKETAVLSDGRVQLSTSTLYGAIRRLLDQGWIERVDDANEAENSRKRKTYRLTGFARRILNAEVARMETLVTFAKHSATGAKA